MASSIAAAPPLSDLSREIEELRRQLASANDAQLASEVSQHHQTVLSNIMLTGQQSGQVAPAENLEGTGSGVRKQLRLTRFQTLKTARITTLPLMQAAQPISPRIKFPLGSGFGRSPQSDPLDGQTLTPDVHLAQSVQLAAAPPSHAEQFSPQKGEAASRSPAVPDINDAPVASAVIADQASSEDAGFSFTVPAASFIDVDVGDSLTLSATLADGSPLPAWLSFDAGTHTFSGTPAQRRCRALSYPRHRNRYRRRNRLPGLHRHRQQYE